MHVKKEELSIKGWIIGVSRILFAGIVMWFASQVQDLSVNIAELNTNLKNIAEITKQNRVDIRLNTEHLYKVDKKASLNSQRLDSCEKKH